MGVIYLPGTIYFIKFTYPINSWPLDYSCMGLTGRSFRQSFLVRLRLSGKFSYFSLNTNVSGKSDNPYSSNRLPNIWTFQQIKFGLFNKHEKYFCADFCKRLIQLRN